MNSYYRSGLYQIERDIARLAENPEEAMELIHLLAQSDWKQIFEEDACTCKKCGSRVQFHQMNFLERTCLVCYEQPKPYTCKQCEAHFMLPWDAPSGIGNGLCSACRTCPCVLCGVTQTWADLRLPLICEQCYTSRHINIQKEIHKLKVQRDRAREFDLPATLTPGQWLSTLIAFKWQCAYCLVNPYKMLDHFIPITRGGGTIASNCVPACKECNHRKGANHPDQVLSIAKADIERVSTYLQSLPTSLPPHKKTSYQTHVRYDARGFPVDPWGFLETCSMCG